MQLKVWPAWKGFSERQSLDLVQWEVSVWDGQRGDGQGTRGVQGSRLGCRVERGGTRIPGSDVEEGEPVRSNFSDVTCDLLPPDGIALCGIPGGGGEGGEVRRCLLPFARGLKRRLTGTVWLRDAHGEPGRVCGRTVWLRSDTVCPCL